MFIDIHRRPADMLSIDSIGVAAFTHLRTCVILIVQIKGKSSILEALNSCNIKDYSSRKEFALFESKFFP